MIKKDKQSENIYQLSENKTLLQSFSDCTNMITFNPTFLSGKQTLQTQCIIRIHLILR